MPHGLREQGQACVQTFHSLVSAWVFCSYKICLGLISAHVKPALSLRALLCFLRTSEEKLQGYLESAADWESPHVQRPAAGLLNLSSCPAWSSRSSNVLFQNTEQTILPSPGEAEQGRGVAFPVWRFHLAAEHRKRRHSPSLFSPTHSYAEAKEYIQ